MLWEGLIACKRKLSKNARNSFSFTYPPFLLFMSTNWTSKNGVVHLNICPNPVLVSTLSMEIILVTQTQACRPVSFFSCSYCSRLRVSFQWGTEFNKKMKLLYSLLCLAQCHSICWLFLPAWLAKTAYLYSCTLSGVLYSFVQWKTGYWWWAWLGYVPHAVESPGYTIIAYHTVCGGGNTCQNKMDQLM